MKQRAICTIVSKNYLGYARALASSIREHHDDLRVFVILVDRLDGMIEPKDEPFELVEAESLGIGDFRDLAFKYDVLEMNTAVKPFALEVLLERHEIDELFYLDPDTYATARLDPIFDHFAQGSILVTPHIMAPYEDDKQPGDSELLRTGAFNLGFVGVDASPQSRVFLRWWQERCRRGCVKRTEDGLFVDQKWIDLVPALFPETFIVRDPGFNVAYWNLHERILGGDGPYTCNGEPLLLFHFSGFLIDDLERISKFQNRFRLSQRPDLQTLFEMYAKRLVESGTRECSKMPYAFGVFDDGTPIEPLMRRLYFSLPPETRASFGDPFHVGDANGFFRWMQEPAVPARRSLPRGKDRRLQRLRAIWQRLTAPLRRDGVINRLMYHLHESELSVRNRFPDIFGRDRRAFLHWFRRHRPEILTGSEVQPYDIIRDQRLLPLHRFSHRSLIPDVKGGYPSARARAVARSDAALGVNALGYFTTESGVGEAARGVSSAIEAAGLPLARNDLGAGPELRRGDTTFSEFARDNPYPFNLIHVNADQLRSTRRQMGSAYFRGHYNIGFWLWELPDFPLRWSHRFQHIDEVWTPSCFCVEAISARSTVPVYRVPIPVEGRVDTELDRGHFGLPEDRFVFLFAFDFMSVFERKNPLATIRAFREAFKPSDDAMLVIKSSNGSRFPEELAAMKKAADGAQIRFLDDYLERNELRNLIRNCDAYVSLHRCEGFGLTMAEAMCMARPVIATAYSANLDFMNGGNSLLVRYEPTEIERDLGPYERGQIWAEPDVSHAAAHMQKVYGDADFASALGDRARRDVSEQLSPHSVGNRIRRRLESLG